MERKIWTFYNNNLLLQPGTLDTDNAKLIHKANQTGKMNYSKMMPL